MSVNSDLLVEDASKARKRALAGLQKVHEAATRERKTTDLGAGRFSLNRPAQKDQLNAPNFRNVGYAIDGPFDSGPNLNGPGIDGVADGLRGSPFGGQKSNGLQIEAKKLLIPGGEEPNISDCISKIQDANVNIVVENGINKQSTDSKCTWASLFETSSEGSLLYTPPKTIGDKKLLSFQLKRLGKIPMELWIEAGLAVVASAVGKPISLDLATKEHRRLSYARVCVELKGKSNMPAEITVSLRGVEFNVSEEVVHKIVPGKGDGLDSEPCGEVVLESFKQLEEGEIRSSPNRHSSQVKKEVGKSDEFTLVTRKKSDLVSVKDRGKRNEVIMPNSFGSLLEVGDADKWALNIIEGSPPPLQVDEGNDVLSGGSSIIGPKGLPMLNNPHDYYSNSGVGRIWVMWKKNRFSFSTCAVDEQFIIGTLTDLLSGVCVEVFCVYASNSNIERRLLWRRLVEITAAWSRPGVVMGDFNAMRVHSEAFGGSLSQDEMEDFDLAIRDANLVEPSVQGNWFTWT
ncbi:uncharacterized protein E5676_scaffold313G002880 [Cucumis melo var. makuwa]|uniref:Uncharacterized protein n=1 Tax=Cucumis melo var. makuwa TaxID=1194695 RepID=A0A5D3DT40_CUCMM|nr:uncharacterized protein E5676_scaffold313G002880 [Cucumis melo var. makuwa]